MTSRMSTGLVLIEERSVDGSVDGGFPRGQIHAEMLLQLASDLTLRDRI